MPAATKDARDCRWQNEVKLAKMALMATRFGFTPCIIVMFKL